MSAKLLQNSQLIRFLTNQQQAAEQFSSDDWQLLFRQARRCNLLGRVAFLLKQQNQLNRLPEKLLTHVDSAKHAAASNRRSVDWEILKIHTALNEANIPFALLKGAAYVAADRDAANGRLFSDVDILVSQENLENCEKALIKHGWMTTKIDAYDQKYYRTWMHELPPMRNLKRRSSLDVHHTILPPTATLKPDIGKIWQQTEPVSALPGVYTLSSIDTVLHSATHLFHEGDFEQGLRDLVDIDALLQEFASAYPQFWQELLARADELGLVRPLYYSLRYCHRLLCTPVPEAILQQAHSKGSPTRVSQFIMDKLLYRAMSPGFIRHRSRFSALANFFFYVRSHHLRMPVWLLLPHLTRKAFFKK